MKSQRALDPSTHWLS